MQSRHSKLYCLCSRDIQNFIVCAIATFKTLLFVQSRHSKLYCLCSRAIRNFLVCVSLLGLRSYILWSVLFAPFDLYCTIVGVNCAIVGVNLHHCWRLIAPLELYCASVSQYYLSFKLSGKVVFFHLFCHLYFYFFAPAAFILELHRCSKGRSISRVQPENCYYFRNGFCFSL